MVWICKCTVVWVHKCVYVCVCVCICVWAHVCWHQVSLLIVLCLLYWVRISHVNPEIASLGSLVSQFPLGISSWVEGLQTGVIPPQHLWQCWGFELRSLSKLFPHWVISPAFAFHCAFPTFLHADLVNIALQSDTGVSPASYMGHIVATAESVTLLAQCLSVYSSLLFDDLLNSHLIFNN